MNGASVSDKAPVAMILAAGRGERMRPLTDRSPKPLLEAGGKALIVHLIEALARAQCRQLVINTAHLGEAIESALGDGRRWGVHVRYSREHTALETAGGIALARPLLGDEPFLVVNGDIWSDLDFAAFVARARTGLQAAAAGGGAALAYLLLADNPPHHPEGDFSLMGGRLTDAPGPRLTFAGVGLYRPQLFDPVVPGSRAALAPLLFAARDRGVLAGEHYRGQWHDIGTPQRLAALDRQLRGQL